ncbi:putative ATP-dependent RNA helicase [Podospora australis]|uniref:ATP-dependent RNA helicase n=1 Tax=Podospora australis TaxID=1536484 RepID=A0AAN6X1Z9_9PEZI|nr:putative ATP-dependent RNA helicase [Podospora australis]
MDILKVLSRGIKQNPKTKTTTQQATTTGSAIPSAGAIVHPQLFHDPVGSILPSRGKKRKRRKDAVASASASAAGDNEKDADEDLSDVDFFAEPKAKKPIPAAVRATEEEKPKKQKNRVLDSEGCKGILRSHRLKFTVLSGLPPAPVEDEEPKKKKKKKSAKAKEEEAAKKKKEEKKMVQLFPQPLTAFGQLKYEYGLNATLADNITRQGFRVPTEVQMGSLPLLLDPKIALEGQKLELEEGQEGGVDFLAVAPTGSGKTIAFLIPAIQGCLRRRAERGGEENVLEAVVVAPTRELATQIVNEGRKLAIGTGVRVVLMKRGLRLACEEPAVAAKADDKEEESSDEEEEEPEKPEEEVEPEEEEESSDSDSDSEKPAEKKKARRDQKDKPIARVDILVTTPKILLNFLSNDGTLTTVKKTLPSVRSLILDEADVLLDPIFRKQTMAIWRACTSSSVSLTCWSATMASNVEEIVVKHLEKRARHHLSPRPLIRLVVGLKDTAVPNITHKLIYTATEPGKLLALRQLLHPVSAPDSGPPLRPPFLVFTQTIERAQSLHDELKYDIPLEAGGSARVAVLHSALSDSVRSKIMSRFRAGEVWVLITTDVLARGVDFAGVNGVVNYDVPTSAAAYIHRAGRTGRAGREGGVAVTFYTKDDIPFVKSIANVIATSEKQAGKPATEGTVQKWLLDALPTVTKEDKRKLKIRGVESRRAGGKASITTKSSWERRREHNRAQAIEASKRRKHLAKVGPKKGEEEGEKGDKGEEWGGLDD